MDCMYPVKFGVRPNLWQTPIPHFRSKVLQMVSCYWGKRLPLRTLNRTKSGWLQQIVHHSGPGVFFVFLFLFCFTGINVHLPRTRLLANSSTVLRATCVLNTPFGGQSSAKGWAYTPNFTAQYCKHSRNVHTCRMHGYTTSSRSKHVPPN